MKTEENIFFNFYTTPRLSINLTDEGGPFGLDIHTALEICYLINFYNGHKYPPVLVGCRFYICF